jgi:hypothetical protein
MTFRLGRLVALGALGVSLLATLSLADASATVKPDSCPTDNPMVVNSYARYENLADNGADGHVWALDAATRSFQIWRVGTNAYCMKLRDVGTFTTFAGVSPEGIATVSGGVTGSFDGTKYVRIYGTFAPKVATTGFIGDFDAQCQQDGTCLGPRPGAVVLYFSSVYFVDFGWFLATYDGGACGTWVQSSSGDSGDIVC